jgi:cellulose 1,4-beta-cellobiosidase
MSSKICETEGYKICEREYCDAEKHGERFSYCAKYGCDYSPYRLGQTEFYGREKVVNTNLPFTYEISNPREEHEGTNLQTFRVVTRFEETGVTQFFIQNGKKINTPPPAVPDFPSVSGLSSEYCDAKAWNFNERDWFNELGGFPSHNAILRRPMVLTLSISDDVSTSAGTTFPASKASIVLTRLEQHWSHNLWLDSIYPLDAEGQPGAARGPCDPKGSAPIDVEAQWRNA